MVKSVILYLEERVVTCAREIAHQSGREVEDVLAEWVAAYADNLPVETLSNDEVLSLCHYELNPLYKVELRWLLSRHRDCSLSRVENSRLEELVTLYRRGIVRRSQALHVAAARGLLTNLQG